MLYRLLVATLLAVAIGGCASRRDPGAAQAAAAPQPVKPVLPAYMSASDYGAGGLVPRMDPSRKINEQDCSKDVDLTGGNLRCR
jgi:hypothetical protein